MDAAITQRWVTCGIATMDPTLKKALKAVHAQIVTARRIRTASQT